MDKKRLGKNLPPEDLKGFEEFIDSQPDDSGFMARPNKKEVSFEHFTFLSNDATRLIKLKNLLMDKIPFASKFEQGERLIQPQAAQNTALKKHIFEICDKPGSTYQKSLGEIFNSFFEPPQP